jgi:precorrin-2 dehydrogenase
MRYYPIFLNIAGKCCLVVGGGKVGFFKTRWLLEAGACVTVVSPEFVTGFGKLDDVKLIRRKFDEADLEGMRLAISATGDAAHDVAFRVACERRSVLYCITSAPEACEFISPSAFERGELTVAISSAGASPALAKRLRRELEEWLPEGFEDYVAFLRHVRDRTKEQVNDPKRRSRIAAYVASREGHEKYLSLDSNQRQVWLDELLSEEEVP